MKRFKSPEHAQRFLEVHDIVAAHFRPKRHLLSATDYQRERGSRFETWQKSSQLEVSLSRSDSANVLLSSRRLLLQVALLQHNVTAPLVELFAGATRLRRLLFLTALPTLFSLSPLL